MEPYSATKSPLSWALAFCVTVRGGMFVLYLDEFGHDGIWDPTDANHCHHPLFGLAGFVIHGADCRNFDREYFRLKCQFYQSEVNLQRQRGVRAERYEPKRLRSRRDCEFAAETIAMVKSYDGTVFAQGIVKSVGRNRHDINKLYTTVARRVLSVYERFLRRRAGTYDGCGLVVMDQRDPVKDVKLLSSLQSQLFSIEFDVRRIAETPLLVPSEWYHGVQAADTIARVAGAVFRTRYGPADKHARKAADRLDTLLTDSGEMLPRGRIMWSTIYVRPPSIDVAKIGYECNGVHHYE